MTLSKLSWEEPTEDYIGWLVCFKSTDSNFYNFYSIIKEVRGTQLLGSFGYTEEEALNPDKNNINSSLTANYRSLGLDYKIIPIRKIF